MNIGLSKFPVNKYFIFRDITNCFGVMVGNYFHYPFKSVVTQNVLLLIPDPFGYTSGANYYSAASAGLYAI